ncbi:ribonuclease [Bacillus sp. JJ864]|uniref:ribonuclease n=1 Tax=Bacillus sp. JJ864 TaxID=3122975 RepID=UPI002FFD7AF8
MQALMVLFFFAAIAICVMIVVAAIKKKRKKKLVISAISCLVLSMVCFSLSPKTDNVKNTETKATSAEPKKKENSNNEKVDQKKEKENTAQQKQTGNTDKTTYENEIKPKIDEMIKEYDEIWNKEWKPVWEEVNKDPSSVDKNSLKEKMESISNKYNDLSKKNIEFKAADKLNDPVLKEKMIKFREEFGLATNYRGNAATAINQGLKGIAPMKGRMEEAKKSINLSDKKIINAAANLTEVETKLGISRN